jgi:hypothetical protein
MVSMTRIEVIKKLQHAHPNYEFAMDSYSPGIIVLKDEGHRYKIIPWEWWEDLKWNEIDNSITSKMNWKTHDS